MKMKYIVNVVIDKKCIKNTKAVKITIYPEWCEIVMPTQSTRINSNR